MTLVDTLNCNEQEAIEELRVRVKNILPKEMSDDHLLFYRFLKARDFDIDKAEAMLRKNLIWRKAFQVDTILETFKPMEFVVKYLKGSFVGFDKEGGLVRYSPVGKIDIKDVVKSVKMSDYMKHCIWFAENDMILLRQENEKVKVTDMTGMTDYDEEATKESIWDELLSKKLLDQTGRNASQVTLIFDLDNLQFGNVTNKSSTELFLKLTQLNQDNYPERMKALYIINAPAYFTLVYSVVKRIMSGAMIRKIQVFGQSGWKEALLKQVDADVLPAFLGGNRTDPDGNPNCETFIHHGGKVPAKYFLTKEQRFFKDTSSVQKINVPQMTKKEVYVDVKENGSRMEWAFQTVSKDIGFGLFYQEAENELVEILPILKFDTSDGTETGSYKCQKAGTYVIVFDNSYSWMSSKEVHYSVNVLKPEI